MPLHATLGHQFAAIYSLLSRLQLPHSQLGYHLSRLKSHISQGQDFPRWLSSAWPNVVLRRSQISASLLAITLSLCPLLLLWYHMRVPTTPGSFATGQTTVSAADDKPGSSADTAYTNSPITFSSALIHLHSPTKATFPIISRPTPPQASPNITLISSVKVTDYTPMTQTLAQFIYPVGSVWPRVYYVAYEEAVRERMEGGKGEMKLERGTVLSDLSNGRVVSRWTSLSAEQTVGIDWKGVQWVDT
ncbi:hypothetical protein L202_00436 [Cryptococcus amylolentus CBS 6039]|uniref:Uncharacterized protein n=1 Tax=Cryptococcus amylolentus CBS 6039 TaxID=1295533 RepID=A0A1E3I712_9TREE|nr:hypothetical protein L202_00436 [Cryptococcus amylolentus CBS 6039]ODN84503.1 hypothetical protein L202_00436 [Cryptococcus amylolentus CBS 6039]